MNKHFIKKQLAKFEESCERNRSEKGSSTDRPISYLYISVTEALSNEGSRSEQSGINKLA